MCLIHGGSGAPALSAREEYPNKTEDGTGTSERNGGDKPKMVQGRQRKLMSTKTEDGTGTSERNGSVDETDGQNGRNL